MYQGNSIESKTLTDPRARGIMVVLFLAVGGNSETKLRKPRSPDHARRANPRL